MPTAQRHLSHPALAAVLATALAAALAA